MKCGSNHLVWIGSIRHDVQQISRGDEVEAWEGQTFGVQVLGQSLFTHGQSGEHFVNTSISNDTCHTEAGSVSNDLFWMSSSLSNRPGLLVAIRMLGLASIPATSSLKSVSMPSKHLESCRRRHKDLTTTWTEEPIRQFDRKIWKI